MAVVDELITLLGLKVDPKAQGEANRYSESLDGAKESTAALDGAQGKLQASLKASGAVLQILAAGAVAAGAALATAAGAIGAYAARQAEAIDQSAKMAEAFGLSFASFQELEFAAAASGAEINEFRMDLENLAKRIADTEFLGKLGIEAKNANGEFKTTDEIITDIAGKFDTLSKAEQNLLTDQLGLNPASLKLFQQGAKGLEQLREEARALGIVLDEDAKKKAAAFQGSLHRSRAVIDALGKSISIGLLPGMTSALDGFADWIIANRSFISSAVTQVVEGVALGFDMVGDAISYVVGLVMSFIGPIDGMVEGLDATQAIAILVAGALFAVAGAVIAATWPFLLAAAAIAAVVLIIDDLYSALTGGESIIGGWAASFGEAFSAAVDEFTAAYPEITKAITSTFAAASEAFDALVELLGTVASFVGDVFVSVFENWGSAVLDVISQVLGAFGDILDAIEAILSGSDPFAVLGDLFMKQVDRILNIGKRLGTGLVDTFKDIFSGIGFGTPDMPEGNQQRQSDGGQQDIRINLTAEQGGKVQGQAATPVPMKPQESFAAALSRPATAPVPAAIIQGGSSSQTVNNNVTNNINGAGNPSAVANELVKRGGLGQTLQQSRPGMLGPVVG